METIYIVIPSMGKLRMEVAGFMMRIVDDSRFNIIRDWSAGKPSEDARCQAITRFLSRPDLDYLMFVDADTCPPDNILDLISYGCDIIGGLYHSFQFNRPFPLAFERLAGDDCYRGITPLPENDLVEVDATGAGCLIIKRCVLETFRDSGIFPFHREYGEDGTVFRGEDVYFCRRAQEMGFKIYVHTGYRCSHFKEVDLLQVQNLLAAEQMRWMFQYEPARYWDRVWAGDGDRYYPELYARIADLVPEGADVLDIGCGTGNLMATLRDSRRCRCAGVDISPHAIDMVRQKGMEGFAWDMEYPLPCDGGPYDAIVCCQVLEHVRYEGAIMESMHRLSGPHARLIVTVAGTELGPDICAEHLRCYDREQLLSLLKPWWGEATVEEIGPRLLAVNV